MVGDQPVDGLALGRHGAALGRRDLLADLRQLAERNVGGEPVRAEPAGGDERPVHDQVGVAPDRRGEMRVAAQVEAEMPEILRRVDGLGPDCAGSPR
ncbi:hypothetical protein ACU4GA_06680 [Methylobacterium oryzae CBMB20]